MPLKLSYHAAGRLATRVGIDPLKVEAFIREREADMRNVSYAEACKITPIYHDKKGSRYFILPDPVVRGKNLVFIAGEDTIRSVLTEDTKNAYGLGGEPDGDEGTYWHRRLSRKRAGRMFK